MSTATAAAGTATAANPVVFITGANAGLGYEIVKSLCQSQVSYTILLGGRDLAKARAAAEKVLAEGTSSVVTPVQVDIEDDESIQNVYDHIASTYGRVDVLINNAGAQFDPQIGKEMTARQAWNKSWDVNVTGTHILTETFAPLLLKSKDARLIFMASGTASCTESINPGLRYNISTPKGWPKPPGAAIFTAYRASKTGMNMLMLEWARLLKADGVKIWAISPGFLATGLGLGDPTKLKQMGGLDPKIGADFVRDVVQGKRDADVGKIIRKDDVQPW
jgi:NAD(P)-dependent dehydrogenase (short-subunit alcohol dehydrogenase family)